MSSASPCYNPPMQTFGKTILRASKLATPWLTILAIPLGFLFLELPSNDALFQMDSFYLKANLFIAAAIFIVFYGVGQRTRGSIIAYLAVFLLAGIANYFVISFKGQPITPADLSALSTAASVSGGYDYILNGRCVLCIALFALMCAALLWQPRSKPRQGYRILTIALNLACAAAVILSFRAWYGETDIEEDYGVSVDVWSVKESYAEQGSALCFLKRMQDIVPHAPEGYDGAAIAQLLAPEVAPQTLRENPIPHDLAFAVARQESAEAPTVIVVMNETFADLSTYPGMGNSGATPQAFRRLAQESLLSGEAYVSALGGGTCNSEFEFLTGSSMGYLGGGVYPYTLYDLSDVRNMASYFSELGYLTTAIHPESASNWSRDRVYAQLGFDRFSDKADFTKADTLRDMTTDAATYEHILRMLQEDERPQFIFDVTMQNHGGYETGMIPKDQMANVVLPNGAIDDAVNEYVSCIQRSDADLAWFVEELERSKRPVVLCFFGDHQPGFADDLFTLTHEGVDVDDTGIDGAQERYHVPYLIWANEPLRELLVESGAGVSHEERATSLNYLGAQLCEVARLPLTSYQEFLLRTSQAMPVINMNGFMDAGGVWHGYGWDISEDLEAALSTYECVQYGNLFDKVRMTQEGDIFINPGSSV